MSEDSSTLTTDLSPLTALGPLDGRYRQRITPLAALFSEAGLIRARVRVELAWFEALAEDAGITELPPLSDTQREAVRAIGRFFGTEDAQRVKRSERTTRHDVKAVEYFVKEALRRIDGLEPYTEFVHFACTSEDINNCAYALLLDEARRSILLPALDRLRAMLDDWAVRFATQPMLSRTHGQPATPTTLGKELRNSEQRLQRQRDSFAAVQALGKLNGAVGNFNAHQVAYPAVDWRTLSAKTLAQLGLEQNTHTTQIEPHDWLAEYSQALVRCNTVLLNLAQDCWHYISIDYFRQQPAVGETGSSTMPHKVNPIDFENAEGNLGLSSALLNHLATKLPISRLQRDLSDSTVLRNLGVALGHTLLACQALEAGFGKLTVDSERLNAELADSWEVLGEAVQTVMRRCGLPEPYERIKAVTRGERLNEARYRALLDDLELPPAAHKVLAELTPTSYLGLAPELAQKRDEP